MIKNMMNKVKETLKNQRGDLFQFIIILAVVAIIAAVTIPDINEKITGKANDAIDRIDAIPTNGTN